MAAKIVPHMKLATLVAALCLAGLSATAMADVRRQLPTDVPPIDTPVAHLRAPAGIWTTAYTIEFEPGATIDFADMTQHQPGPLRGFVYVRMQGELVVIPVYRPTQDGTVWRIDAAQLPTP